MDENVWEINNGEDDSDGDSSDSEEDVSDIRRDFEFSVEKEECFAFRFEECTNLSEPPRYDAWLEDHHPLSQPGNSISVHQRFEHDPLRIGPNLVCG